tara:strand:+ start:1790 stop:2473 length:684 start_codon:yes stop_codon:yes gene_type:complete
MNMDDSTLYIAFEASPPLQQAIERFIDGMLAAPGNCHLEELDALVVPFVEEVLAVFFQGPLEAAEAKGASAKLILRAMKVINRAADSLIGRMLKNTTVEEQLALARYFCNLRRYQNGSLYVAYPLNPAIAQTAPQVFEVVLAGGEDLTDLLDVLQAINDSAITHFMDNSVACLTLGRVNRALVSAARVTICKASVSATHKGLPSMDACARKAVVHYFDQMLIRCDDG